MCSLTWTLGHLRLPFILPDQKQGGPLAHGLAVQRLLVTRTHTWSPLLHTWWRPLGQFSLVSAPHVILFTNKRTDDHVWPWLYALQLLPALLMLEQVPQFTAMKLQSTGLDRLCPLSMVLQRVLNSATVVEESA